MRCSVFPAPRRGHGQGGHSLSQKRMAPLNPQEKGFDIASEQLEELQCLPIALPARGVAALALLYDLAYFYYLLPLC